MRDFDRVIEEAKAVVMPYESWERLDGESPLAFSAFCVYRDMGLERNIRKAVDLSFGAVEKTDLNLERRYRVWRNWATAFRWRERGADFDRYVEKLRQGELRKTIEAQGEKHREVTGKMLDVVSKKLDCMNPEDLSQGNVSEWVQTAIKTEREAAGLFSADNKTETKQGELNFVSDFDGL